MKGSPCLRRTLTCSGRSTSGQRQRYRGFVALHAVLYIAFPYSIYWVCLTSPASSLYKLRSGVTYVAGAPPPFLHYMLVRAFSFIAGIFPVLSSPVPTRVDWCVRTLLRRFLQTLCTRNKFKSGRMLIVKVRPTLINSSLCSVSADRALLWQPYC